MNRWILGLSLCGSVALSVPSAHATNIPIPINSAGGLYNTGVTDAGVVIADGATDTHYTGTPPIVPPATTGTPASETAVTSAGGFPVGPWLGDDTKSTWISLAGHGNEVAGAISNITTFTSPSTGQIYISGNWATDDAGTDILLNGVSTGSTANGFGGFTPFGFTSNAVAGVNTIAFINNNGGGPGGVRVELASAELPEPGSLSLVGLAAFAVLRRRRSV